MQGTSSLALTRLSLTYARPTSGRLLSGRSIITLLCGTSCRLSRRERQSTQKHVAGFAITGCPAPMSAVLGFLKRCKTTGFTHQGAVFMNKTRKVLAHMDRGEGKWIDVLCDSSGEPFYQACGRNGTICRITNDLWQAEIYVQYY